MKPITKSLFVDYCDFPKLAWWKVTDSSIYKRIRKIESDEQEEHIISIGQAVENVVSEYLQKTYKASQINLMPEIRYVEEIIDEEDEDQEDFVYFPKWWVDPYEVIAHNTRATLEAIRNKEKILYQPWFSIDGCFVRADFMILQENGQYDLIEVKAKSSIRKKVDHEKVEYKNTWNIDDKFVCDTSFQRRVINKVFKQEWLPEIGNVYVYYLNRDYVKFWPIDVMQLVAKDQMWTATFVTLPWEKKDKQVDRVDNFMPDESIEKQVVAMKTELWLSEQDFNIKHPFPGNKYLKYFGKNPDFWTICAIPKLHHSKADTVQKLYFKDKLNIIDLSTEEKDCFNSATGFWSAREFIERYTRCIKTWECIIDNDKISEILNGFTYPICFYDYETISVPVPIFDNTHPYQQVVVQYSLHKYYEDGHMEHFWWLLVNQWEANVDQITIDWNGNAVEIESEKVVIWSYKDLLKELIKDIWSDIEKSTFIVWYKPFENTRNKEIGEKFPDLKDEFMKINEKTYDLMEIFSQNMYFDLEFHGSSSIKKVLPVMVPSMKYDDLAVKNWWIAMQKLEHLINWKISDPEERLQTTKNLLIYCGQDSLAMVRIYEKLLTL